MRFSIGAGDRQALQPPLSSTLPVTGTTVFQLFEELGMFSSFIFSVCQFEGYLLVNSYYLSAVCVFLFSWLHTLTLFLPVSSNPFSNLLLIYCSCNL